MMFIITSTAQEAKNSEATTIYVGAQGSFKSLWNSINGNKYPWDSNPWVMRVEFEKGEG